MNPATQGPSPLDGAINLIPDVSVYARHNPKCRFQKKEADPNCQCKKYLYVSRTPQSKERRIPTYSRSWGVAEHQAQELRDSFNPKLREAMLLKKQAEKKEERKHVTLENALKLWIADREKDNGGEPVRQVYYTIQDQLKAFASARGLHFLHEIDAQRLTEWRTTWGNKKKGGIRGKQSRVINFFGFCVRMGWLEKNIAGGRSNPDGGMSKVVGDDWEPMAPLTKEQYQAVLEACDRYPVHKRSDSKAIPARIRAFTQLLRWSGLSPIDALKLPRTALSSENVITVARAKTGKSLSVMLPAPVADELRAVPPPRRRHPDHVGQYFFWDGKATDGALRGTYLNWYKKLWPLVQPKLELKTLKGTPYKPHPYIFRATFGVEYLTHGGDVHDLAKLLGNTVAMCEKHYVQLVEKLREKMLERQAATFAAQGAPGAPKPTDPGNVVNIKRPAASAIASA